MSIVHVWQVVVIVPYCDLHGRAILLRSMARLASICKELKTTA
jgi:hypothetical protein